jgi:hypothetical protein
VSGREPTREQCEEARRKIVETNRKALDKVGADDSYCYRKMMEFAEYLQPIVVKKLKKVGSRLVVVEEHVRLDTPKAVVIQQNAVLAIAEWRGVAPSKSLEVQGVRDGIPVKLMVEFVKPLK